MYTSHNNMINNSRIIDKLNMKYGLDYMYKTCIRHILKYEIARSCLRHILKYVKVPRCIDNKY